MLTSNRVDQSNNNISGDQAGRDITKTIHNNTSYNFNSVTNTNITMLNLLRKYQEEKESNPDIKYFIEELDYYNTTIDRDVIGLEKKLTDGNYENFINYALKAKDRYHRKLYKFQFSEAAQEINVYLLALVENYFMGYIYPQLCKGESYEQISILIQNHIISPLLKELDANDLGFNAQDINGMLFFLTGNCHLNWCK
jgi:hypothetical protein